MRLALIFAPLVLIALANSANAQSGDAEAGQRAFSQCRACHTINEGGRNGVGPNLYGIVGQPAGQREGFRYSADLRARAAEGLTWDEDSLRRYLTSPKSVVPLGNMAFRGFSNPQQVDDVIAYLRANGPT